MQKYESLMRVTAIGKHRIGEEGRNGDTGKGIEKGNT